MKKLGLVGGLAWPSTADYYRLLCEGTIAHFDETGHQVDETGHQGLLPTPPVMIESLVMAETRLLRGETGNEKSWSAFDDVFRNSINRLEVAGCEFAAIASNTPHARLHAIRNGINIPVISIIEASARKTAQSGFTSALVLGTSVTMREHNYAQALKKFSVVANPPLADAKIDHLQQVIDTEFYKTAESDNGRTVIIDYCKTLVTDPKSTAVLLACTELPLAFPEHSNSAVFTSEGFNFVNTSVVHVEAILDFMLGRVSEPDDNNQGS